jgi:hypothetical protein
MNGEMQQILLVTHTSRPSLVSDHQDRYQILRPLGRSKEFRYLNRPALGGWWAEIAWVFRLSTVDCSTYNCKRALNSDSDRVAISVGLRITD